MARLIRQPDTIRQDFYTRIQSKIQREKEAHQQRVMREIPFLGDILSTGYHKCDPSFSSSLLLVYVQVMGRACALCAAINAAIACSSASTLAK